MTVVGQTWTDKRQNLRCPLCRRNIVPDGMPWPNHLHGEPVCPACAPKLRALLLEAMWPESPWSRDNDTGSTLLCPDGVLVWPDGSVTPHTAYRKKALVRGGNMPRPV